MRRPAILLAALCSVALLAPVRAQAQGPRARALSPSRDELAAVARLRGESGGVRMPVAQRAPATTIAARKRKRGQSETLMIVGAAGIVTGLLLDESIITIAGVGVGGFGLYLHLRD